MPPKGGGGGDKSKQFFDGISTQKQDAIRWCLNYGGISVATRNDDGYTGLHLSALLGKPRSMETILDHLRRAVLSRGGGDIRGPPGPRKKKCEELEEKDEEKGMTAFMHACAKGNIECVRLLHECGVDWNAKSDEGLTALDYAKKHKYESIVQWFARGGKDEEEEEEDDNTIEEIEGETGAERRKRIKALKAGGEKFANLSKKDAADGKADAEDDKEDDIGPGPEPQWEEIKQCRASALSDLTCVKLGDEKAVDPSLWYCRHVNNLKLRMPPGVLKELPKELSYLKSLTTLIVSNNALTSLPEALISLEHLKNLEFADNKIKEFPADMKNLDSLEVIDACRNAMETIEPLKGNHDLVTLKLDQNKIKSIDALSFKKLTRLQALSASHNEISSLSGKISQLRALTSLNLSNNNIKELPVEMGDFKEKVLLHLSLDENPLKDSKVKKILEKGRAPVKELLAHLRKEAESGRGKKKKGKGSDEEEEEEEEEEQEEVKEEEKEEEEEQEEAAAPAAGGGGGGGKNKKKGGKGKGKGGGGGGGGGMSEEQKKKAREEALRKLGMAVPAAPGGKSEDKKEEKKEEKTEETEEAKPDFEAEGEADEDELAQYMHEGGSDLEHDTDEDVDDFLSESANKESEEDRRKRVALELQARQKGKVAMDKEREQKKKEHEEWLASMTEEMRQLYFEDQKRKQRAAEEKAQEEELATEKRRQEEVRRRAAASGGAPQSGGDDAAAAKKAGDKMDSKWHYADDKLIKEVVERKGPKKPIKEIQLRLPSRKIGIIIGKGGVNIKIIEAKSQAKVKIFKPQEGAEGGDETLITVKGTPEQVDRCCETINLVFAQWKAQRQTTKAPSKK